MPICEKHLELCTGAVEWVRNGSHSGTYSILSDRKVGRLWKSRLDPRLPGSSLVPAAFLSSRESMDGLQLLLVSYLTTERNSHGLERRANAMRDGCGWEMKPGMLGC
jgi:hypothetical protein